MPFSIPISSAVLLLAALTSLGVAGYALRQRRAPGAVSFVLVAVAVAVWAGCDGLQTLLPSTEAKIRCSQAAYLGIASLPALMLNFTLRYTRQMRLLRSRWRARALWIVPALTLGMVWTNDLHHLHWAHIEPVASGTGLAFTYGPYFWVHTAYSYLLLAGSTAALVVALVRFPHLYRRQTAALIAATLIPWAGNFFYLLLENPFPGFDPTTLAFTAAVTIFGYALFRFELLNLTPVARDILIESMTDALLVLDRDNRVADANPAAQRLLNRAPQKIIGQPVEAVLPLPGGFQSVLVAHRPPGAMIVDGQRVVMPAPAARPARPPRWPRRAPLPYAPRANLYATQLIEIEIELSEDPQIVLEMRISPVHNHFREQTGWLVVLRNITERKRMEEELRQARDTAEAASRFKSEFLANMSHEIRTPMNAVIGMTSLLVDTPLSEEQREWLEIVRSSGESLLSVINDILDYSRVESGKLPLEHQPYRLRAVIEESLEVVAVHAAEKNVELLYELSDGAPEVLVGDANRLRQVLVNLLTNAVKFTEQGQVLLSARSGADVRLDGDVPGDDAPQWHEMRFAVKDTGIGIPAEQMDRLFQPFSQLDPGARQPTGSGLGLAISKRLVEMMGGRIWVESEVGLGSTFAFLLWAPAGSPAECEAAAAAVLPPEARAVLEGKRLLIVDPHPKARQILAGLAEQAGMAARTAASTGDALAQLERAAGAVKRRGAGLLRLPRAESGPPARGTLGAWLEPVARQAISALGGAPDGQDPAPPPVDAVLVDRQVSSVEQLAAALPGVPLVMMAPAGKSLSAGYLSARLLKPVRPARMYSILSRCLRAAGDPLARWPGEAAADALAPTVPLPAAGRAPAPPLAPHAGLRILVAEDNPTNQRVLQLILKQLGYASDLAGDGLRVMEALAQRVYDVIFMDMQMPGLDGLETTRLVRDSLPPERQPRIIAMTANAMQGDRERCLAAGMDDYLSKPVRNSELSAALRACARLSAEDSPPPPAPGGPTEAPAAPAQAGPPAVAQVRAELDEAAPEPAPPDGEDEPQPVDRELLDNMAHFLGPDGGALIGEVVHIFAQSTPGVIQQVGSALQRGDLLSVQQAAHSLKSSAATLGMLRLSRSAAQLETAARDALASPSLAAQPVARFGVLYDELRAEFDRANTALKDLGF